MIQIRSTSIIVRRVIDMDQVLELCYEAEINIQNTNYEILKEQYENLIVTEGDIKKKAKDTWKKFCETVQEFFKKVVEAMARTLTKVLTLSKKLDNAAFGSSYGNDSVMDDILVPPYQIDFAMAWAKCAISQIDKTGSTEFEKFEDYAKSKSGGFDDINQLEKTTYGVEKNQLNGYKTAVAFVKQQARDAKTRYKYDYSTIDDDKSAAGKQRLKKMFAIQKEAISLIQKRVNASVKYITTAMRRSYKFGNVKYYKVL